MIDKLERVKKALEVSTVIFDSLGVLPKYTKQVKVALAELNEVMERINSEELVDNMAKAIADKIGNGMREKYITHAQEAINIIRGKDND